MDLAVAVNITGQTFASNSSPPKKIWMPGSSHFACHNHVP